MGNRRLLRPSRPVRAIGHLSALLAVFAVTTGASCTPRKADGKQAAPSTQPSPSTAPAGSTPRTIAPPGTTAVVPTQGTSADTAPRSTTRGTPVPPGSWGGQGIHMSVTASGARIEYDCAAGTISEPLVADSNGLFEVSGAHTFESGGARQPGMPSPPSQPARYQGWTDGRQMQLTVSLPEAHTELGSFALGITQPPLLDRCV
jgi:hypothetical protein